MNARRPTEAPPEVAGRSSSAWLLVAALVGVLALLGVGYVARDPRRRKRALRRVGTAWDGVENVARRSTRKLQRKRRRIAEEASRIVTEALEALEELPFQWAAVEMKPVTNQFYGHGAFMGAAPALLADAQWRRILAFLMPDVYRDVREAVHGGAPAGAIIPMFENNPVMCAFGVWRGARARAGTAERGRHDLAGQEWDVFLSGELVHRWEDAPEEARPDLVRRLVDGMVIAHASTTDTVQEQIGLCQWADVRRTRKTRLGGVEPAAWMDLFARALTLAQADDLATAIGTMSKEPRIRSDEECLDHTFAQPIDMKQAIEVYRRVTGRKRFSVVLEIKSLRITSALLEALVAELNRRGLHVEAVGSFLVEEIRGVAAITQNVGGEALPGPREILLLHFAGDLQLACDRGLLPDGGSAMFNGASLLLARQDGAGRFSYEIDRVTLEGVEDYRRAHGLHLGLYVQEHDCDAAAASLLSELVATHPATFELGFAWGGVLDEASIAAGLGDHRGFGGQRVLQRLGYGPAWKRRPLSTFG